MSNDKCEWKSTGTFSRTSCGHIVWTPAYEKGAPKKCPHCGKEVRR